MKLTFPFGSQLQKVEQKDKTSKKVFVLGVYASAVHARWIGADGKIKVKALAVASEPYIFWKGDNAEQVIKEINIPQEAGKLIPAEKRFGGPSGNALDELFLKPLGYTREDAWLCDLLPYSRINPHQQEALDKHYNPLIKKFNLPVCNIPNFDIAELKNLVRVNEIADELEQSQAGKIILLGDSPIEFFLSHFSNYRKLSDFGCTNDEYGKEHLITIRDKTYSVIPLVHPRQAAALGRSSWKWKNLHSRWIITSTVKK